MIFNWLKARRRNKVLASPFPIEWDAILQHSIPQVEVLTTEQQDKLRRWVRIFVAEKNWEGCNGLKLTEEMRVTIAAMAGLLVVGFPYEEYFDHVLSILVYPDSYVMKNTQVLGTGTVIEGQQARAGEAWYRGPVIVSWADIQETARNETFGRNVVLHEFAHQLDMLNGRVADGEPVMGSPEKLVKWNGVMQSAYDQLVAACSNGERSLIDCYGATSRAEFFAVTTELFFEAPTPLRHWYPAVYEQLAEFYSLDPAQWGT